ncbi:MAG: hypothetical protein MRY74_04675 [Neomegalonema sp.]|nr:hypothetical protein [Neomegalonema sp.]
MNDIVKLTTPIKMAPGLDGLATPLLGLIVLAAIMARVMLRSRNKGPDE